MHIVMRSSVARGVWSFVRPNNRNMIAHVLAKHASTTGVEIIATGNAGNHLHLRVRFPSLNAYKHFIRAVTGEVALKIKKIANSAVILNRGFWDSRPFSCIVSTLGYATRLTDYIKINQLEGRGFNRAFACLVVKRWRDGTFPEFDGGVLIVSSQS
ncbi:MAG: hypothetical protein A2Z20_02205 [Bdellovibrionales bacterium RBG_16_40_8]|nr:MAG: hypothetical protein A2Z20_02205 [Bdellovibrionales bacterium RBG_16_40_8]